MLVDDEALLVVEEIDGRRTFAFDAIPTEEEGLQRLVFDAIPVTVLYPSGSGILRASSRKSGDTVPFSKAYIPALRKWAAGSQHSEA